MSQIFYAVIYDKCLIVTDICTRHCAALHWFRCRPNKGIGYYQTGYVENGALHNQNSGYCTPHGRPNYNGFFVIIMVHSNINAQIFISSITRGHVTQVNPHFKVTPRFGAIVANGYNNIVQAMHFIIKKRLI